MKFPDGSKHQCVCPRTREHKDNRIQRFLQASLCPVWLTGLCRHAPALWALWRIATASKGLPGRASSQKYRGPRPSGQERSRIVPKSTGLLQRLQPNPTRAGLTLQAPRQQNTPKLGGVQGRGSRVRHAGSRRQQRGTPNAQGGCTVLFPCRSIAGDI